MPKKCSPIKEYEKCVRRAFAGITVGIIGSATLAAAKHPAPAFGWAAVWMLGAVSFFIASEVRRRGKLSGD